MTLKITADLLISKKILLRRYLTALSLYGEKSSNEIEKNGIAPIVNLPQKTIEDNVRQSIENTLNALLNAEANAICQTPR